MGMAADDPVLRIYHEGSNDDRPNHKYKSCPTTDGHEHGFLGLVARLECDSKMTSFHTTRGDFSSCLPEWESLCHDVCLPLASYLSMADSQQQNPHPEDKPKTVFIFAGATTPEFEKKFSDEAKKQGAAAVEFVNVPDVPFADPKVELELEAADNVCKLYEQRLADFLELFKKIVNSLSWRDQQTPLEIKTIHHLCDRIIHVPAHVLMLHKEDPIYSYIDCASLNRSLFESAVNCLYLFQDKTNRAFASLISKSIDEDIKRNNELLNGSPTKTHASQQARPSTDQSKRTIVKGANYFTA